MTESVRERTLCRSGIGPVQEWLEQRKMAGTGARLDTVLVTHPRDEDDFPRLFPWGKQLTSDERRQLTRLLRPAFAEIIETPLLSVGLLILPIYAADILAGSPTACLELLQGEGLTTAASVGARLICLGGLTGALSLYGTALQARADQLGITVTTGHSITAVTVLETFLRAGEELGIEPSMGRLVILGVGSVGAAFARLVARQPSQPASIVLVDRPNRRARVEKLARELQEMGRAPVSVELTSKEGRLSPSSACYNCLFLVSASSTPEIVDVDRVSPGTILVDDSQPYCWSRVRAWERCIRQHDIAPCEAGLVDCRSIGYRSLFPFDFSDHNETGTCISWSCMAEGLLWALESGLPPTIGEPKTDSLQEWRNAFSKWGLRVPCLQCGPHNLPIADLRAFFQAIGKR